MEKTAKYLLLFRYGDVMVWRSTQTVTSAATWKPHDPCGCLLFEKPLFVQDDDESSLHDIQAGFDLGYIDDTRMQECFRTCWICSRKLQ